MARKFLVFLSATILTLLLFMTALSSITLSVFTSENLKRWLNESGFYENIVNGIIEQQDDVISANEEYSVNLQDPKIQAIFKNVFTAEFIRNSSEDVISGIDGWLKGDTENPEFAINVANLKVNLANSIGSYAQKRYDALPLCKSGQIPANPDILTISCRVPGYKVESEIAKAVKDLKVSEDFLPDSSFSAEDVKLGNDNIPLFTRIERLPEAYQKIKLAPIVLSVLSLGAIVTILLATKDKRRGLRRIMLSLYAVVAILVLEIIMVLLSINRAVSELTKGASGSPSLQAIGLKIVQAIQNDINHYLILFIIGFGIPAVVISVYLLITRTKRPKNPPETPKTPEKSNESGLAESSSNSDPEKPKPKTPQKLIQ